MMPPRHRWEDGKKMKTDREPTGNRPEATRGPHFGSKSADDHHASKIKCPSRASHAQIPATSNSRRFLEATEKIALRRIKKGPSGFMGEPMTNRQAVDPGRGSVDVEILANDDFTGVAGGDLAQNLVRWLAG